MQSFTGDPAVLKAAIESYRPATLPQHGSTLSQPQLGSSSMATGAGSTRGGSLIAQSALQVNSLLAFQAEQAAPMLQARIETTLAAMRAIARELSGHPGRKNLVWVSAGFPVSLVPETNEVTFVNTRASDPTAPPPLPTEQTYASYNQGIRQQSTEDVRRTSALLADAQIAIYPVDARGLIGSGTSDASTSGKDASGLLMLGTDFGQSVGAASVQREAPQAAMTDLAQETGGRVFINRNDIDNSVATAASDGGTYYALGYYPDKKKFDGSFHKLKVTLNRPGVQTRYRRGFFALDHGKLSNKEKENELATTLRNEAQATQVLFDARVVPPPPAAKMRVPVQFLVRAETFTTEEAPAGGRQVNLDFFTAAFTLDGKPAANLGQTVNTAVTAEQFAQIQQQGLLLPMELTLPPGQYLLRLAVRDNRTGYLGTLTVPLDLSKTAP
jgi:VWFA-related protein